MTVTSISTNTFLADTIVFLRDDFLNNITDPISATRPSVQKFVMTSYPVRGVTPPMITIKYLSTRDKDRLGMQSNLHWYNLDFEVRIWAKGVAQRDEISQQVINRIRSNFQPADTSGTYTNVGLTAESSVVLNTIDIDEPGTGIHSRIVQMRVSFILGS